MCQKERVREKGKKGWKEEAEKSPSQRRGSIRLREWLKKQAC